MKIINLYGKEVKFNPSKYSINWDKVVSKPQQKVKDVVKDYWSSHLVCEEMVIPGSKLRIDLINFNLLLAIEISPSSSHSYNEFFHKNRSKYLISKKNEVLKDHWCIRNHIRLIEIFDEDLNNEELLTSKIFKYG